MPKPAGSDPKARAAFRKRAVRLVAAGLLVPTIAGSLLAVFMLR
ncbi:MAG: hypothetical protein AAF601_08345 [Pseudomonadota bacterium]